MVIILSVCVILVCLVDLQTNTFQGLVITNNSVSYAVYIYKCGLMHWDGEATIGFKADRTYFRNNPLSGRDDADSISCTNSPLSIWTNVIYRLVKEGEEMILHKFIYVIL